MVEVSAECVSKGTMPISLCDMGRREQPYIVQRLVTWKRRRKPERRSEGGARS
jgi:hypothetical protein